MRLASKTALITGGNSGSGLATARLFLADEVAKAAQWVEHAPSPQKQ